MTLWDIMQPVARRAHKVIAAADATSDDYLDVLAWVQEAVRYLTKVNNWECHKAEWELTTATTPALTAGTYSYALRTLKSDYRLLQGDAVYYADYRLEFYAEIAEVDRRLGGPRWKRAAGASGVPLYASLLGNSLVLAPKPSAAFVSQYGTDGLYGYYWRSEAVSDVSATLFLYDDFFPDLVEVSLIFGLQQEDDAESRTQLNLWESKRLPLLRGHDPAPMSDDQVDTAAFALGVEGIE